MSISNLRAGNAYIELLDPEAPQIAVGWASLDPAAVWLLLQKLTCPIVCVGYVNETGWHQECQKRAQAAMVALGLDAPGIDPMTQQEGTDEWTTDTHQ